LEERSGLVANEREIVAEDTRQTACFDVDFEPSRRARELRSAGKFHRDIREKIEINVETAGPREGRAGGQL
jgi:hypothetical protein